MKENNRKFVRFLAQNKVGFIASVIVILLGYGYSLTNVSISTDDTAFDMYFDYGYSLRMGRIVMTLIQKVFDIVEFTPFWTELIAVQFLVFAAWRMAYVLDEKSSERLSRIFVASFVCIFISFPLINEIFIYSSMSVSVGMGYFFSVYALEYLYLYYRGKRKSSLVLSIFFLICAISLYESFIPVFFCLTMISIFTEIQYKKISWIEVVKKSLPSIGIGAAAILINFVLGQICIRVGNLTSLNISANKNIVWTEQSFVQSVKSVLRTLFYDQFIAGVEYLPILIFVIATLLLTIITIHRMIKQRSFSPLICLAGIYISAELIVFLQGQTYYRSCQAFAIIVAFTGAIFVDRLYQIKLRKLALSIVAVTVLVQTQDLSRWFYLENQCSEAESNLVTDLIVDMKREGMEDKRIAFIYDLDDITSFDYYGSYYSISTNSFIRKVANSIASKFTYTSSPEFIYELNRKHNQTNCLTTYLQYGVYAFDNGIMGPNYELKKYMEPYFFNFEQVTWDEWHEAQKFVEDIDSYPSNNYWKDMGDYIIVYIGI